MRLRFELWLLSDWFISRLKCVRGSSVSQCLPLLRAPRHWRIIHLLSRDVLSFSFISVCFRCRRAPFFFIGLFLSAGVIHLPRPFVPFGMRVLPRKVRPAERKVRFISWRRLRLPVLVPKMTFGLMCGLERGSFGGVECSKRRLQGDDTPSQWFIVSRCPFFVCALENWRCTAVFFFFCLYGIVSPLNTRGR